MLARHLSLWNAETVVHTVLSTIRAVDDLRAAFGRRVRTLRHRLQISQEELAHRSGMHWTYLGGIERGERNPALINIARLAAALQVSPAELFSIFTQRPARKGTTPQKRRRAER